MFILVLLKIYNINDIKDKNFTKKCEYDKNPYY